MNKLIISFLFTAQALNAWSQTINYSNSSGASGCAQNNTLSFWYSEGSPVRNVYKGTIVNGFAEAQVRWNGVDKWIIQHDIDGIGPTAPVTYYSNTFASYPNPPDLNTGTWTTVNATCGSITAFSGTGTQSVLPVELTKFTVSVQGGIGRITWRTASETQNAHFLVQHSTDGRSFQDLAQIPGKGNSQVENRYEYLHENPAPGTNYYRLKQVDFDGGFEFSPIISVNIEQRLGKVQVYPNPFSDGFRVEVSAGDELPSVQAQVYDVNGRVVWQGQLHQGVQSLELPALPAGVYWLETDLGNRVERVRVVKK